jgi:hypothetical protein
MYDFEPRGILISLYGNETRLYLSCTECFSNLRAITGFGEKPGYIKLKSRISICFWVTSTKNYPVLGRERRSSRLKTNLKLNLGAKINYRQGSQYRKPLNPSKQTNNKHLE